jgi:hypothetical protein
VPVAGVFTAQAFGVANRNSIPTSKLDFCCCLLFSVLVGEAGFVLESPDQNVQLFFVFIELPWLFMHAHTHTVFDEMLVRQKVLLWFCL